MLGASAEGWAPPWVESWAWAASIFFWAAGEEEDRPACLPPSAKWGQGTGCPTAPHSLTDAACVLKLDLKHLHGGGHDDLASTSPAACQHLPVQGQLLPAAERMGATVKSRSPSTQGCAHQGQWRQTQPYGHSTPSLTHPLGPPATGTEPNRQMAPRQGLGRVAGPFSSREKWRSWGSPGP